MPSRISLPRVGASSHGLWSLAIGSRVERGSLHNHPRWVHGQAGNHLSVLQNSHREQADDHGDTMHVQKWGTPAVFHTAATRSTCLLWKQYQHQRKALMSLPSQSQSSGLRAYDTGKAALWHVGSRGREAPLRPSRPKQSAITYGFRADGALSHCK